MIDCHIQLQQGQFCLDQRYQSDQPVIGLFGASGSGKTTILHSIAGLIRPHSGWIRVQDQTWFDQAQKVNLSTQQRRVGLVFQDAQLFPHKNVKQNLLFGFKHIAPQQRQFELDYMIELLKLGHLTERMPIKLSGGEKQRVALGRALLYSPQLLLLDEPLSALDSAHKAEIIPFFQRVKEEVKIPMLYVSHDRSEIEQLTDEIWHL
ncbi:ATP-binding cassette domain-containing protein [Acinetobacter vivianii]|uniref:ATP-binding cassette domain-containing protein n=1 Tax=Acinetobacter vivianii TaxID=1776742 RepID=UPI002DB7414A|nr:ATP-binding cassette domain-containing protein [Acinetobacter vivianii]MEB6666774.1 ATP-binding cassette domain-containing protein [Acinetobacter vivianii]